MYPPVDDQAPDPDVKPNRIDTEPAPSPGAFTRRGRTMQRQRQFLGTYVASGLIGKAAAAAGVTRQATLKWRRDPGFQAAMARARHDHLYCLAATRTDTLQAEMDRFAQYLGTLDGPALGTAAAGHSAAASRRTPSAAANHPSRPTRDVTARVSPVQQAHRQLRFLRAYAEYGTIRAACRALHLERATVQHWRETDDAFEALFLHAQEEHREVIYDALFQRGVIGTLTPVWCRGKQVGQVRTYDHTARALLVRLRFPKAFARMRSAPQGPPPQSVSVVPQPVLVPLDQLSDDELGILEQLYRKRLPDRM